MPRHRRLDGVDAEGEKEETAEVASAAEASSVAAQVKERVNSTMDG